MPVTARQRQVFEFISRYQETHKQPPTIAEIGKQFKMSSSASVHSILMALEREGRRRKHVGSERDLQAFAGIDEQLQRAVPQPVGIHAVAETAHCLLHLTLLSVLSLTPRGLPAFGASSYSRGSLFLRLPGSR